MNFIQNKIPNYRTCIASGFYICRVKTTTFKTITINL